MPLLADEIAGMKRQMTQDINTVLQRFREATGLSPSDIDVRMADVTHVGDMLRVHMVVDVELRFNL